MLFLTQIPKKYHHDALLFIRSLQRNHGSDPIWVITDTPLDIHHPLVRIIPSNGNTSLLPPRILEELPSDIIAYVDPSLLILNPLTTFQIPPLKLVCCEDTLASRCRQRYHLYEGGNSYSLTHPFIPLSNKFFLWDNGNPPKELLATLVNTPLDSSSFNRAVQQHSKSLEVSSIPFIFSEPLLISSVPDYWKVVNRIPYTSKDTFGFHSEHIEAEMSFNHGSSEVTQSIYKSIASKYYPSLLPIEDNKWQVIVISQNQAEIIPDMVQAIKSQLPGIPLYFVVDRSKDSSARVLEGLGVPFTYRDGPEKVFRAGSSRDEGLRVFGIQNTLFLDGDRIPFNLSKNLLDQGLSLLDLACLKFLGGSEHRLRDSFCPSFSHNELLAPYIFQEDPKNRFYTNGFFISEKAITKISAMIGGGIFYKAFEGRHGDEDVFLGALASLLGFQVGFFPVHAGTGGPLSQGAKNPYATPANRGTTLAVYGEIKKLQHNEKLSKGVPLLELNYDLKKMLSSFLGAPTPPQYKTPIDILKRLALR